MFTHSSKTDSNKTKAVSANKEKTQGDLDVPSYLVSPQNVMQLQSTIGNSAVVQLMKSQSPQQTTGLPIQRIESRSDTSSNLLAARFRIPNMFHAPVQKKSDLEMEQHKNNSGMPDSLKAGVENLSGLSMDDVRVHYNSDKPAQVGALAYTKGTDIHIAAGQEKHLSHEAWHVVQQAQGRVRPTMHMKGLGVNENEAFEHEADIMGEKLKSGAFQNYSPSQEENTGTSLYNNNVLEPITLNNDLPIQMVKYVIVQATKQCKRVDDGYELKWGERLATQSEEPKIMAPKPMEPKPMAPTHQVGLDYPRGFSSYQDFRDKTRPIAQQARSGRVIVSGSSVTGLSYKEKIPFRSGKTVEENSDIDVGIVDSELYQDESQVDERGFPVFGSDLSYTERGAGSIMKKQNMHKMGIKVFDRLPPRKFIDDLIHQ